MVNKKALSLWLVLMFSLVNHFAFGMVSTEPLNITVIGSAVISKDPTSARQQAISNALQKAIEQAIITIVPPDSLVQNIETLANSFLPKSQLFIQNYRVLAEFKNNTSYSVLVQTQVLQSKLDQEISSVRIVPQEVQLPKILLCISEKNLDDILPNYWWKKTSGGGWIKTYADVSMAAILRSKNFEIIDPSTRKSELDAIKKELSYELQTQDIMMLGSSFGADIVIYGMASIMPQRSGAAQELEMVIVQLQATAYRTKTGETITSTTQNIPNIMPSEIAEPSVFMNKIGQVTGEDICKKLSETYQKKQHNSLIPIALILQGTKNQGYYSALIKKLEQVPMIKKLSMLEMTLDNTVYNAEIQGSVEELMKLILQEKFNGFTVQINTVTTDKMILEIVAATLPTTPITATTP